ncbi:hypothetical protein F5Y16DRAFT_369882 [Xylariaceae sp. FL0255]|nr:hypothetical protein F5Y16DRAFT_369882 [Xylariaceae sp. FL0255]
MSTTWLRAFRYAALHHRPRLLTRSLHASLPRHRPDDSANPPRKDGENKTEEGNKDGTTMELDKEKDKEKESESQGRKRPANGLKSRTQRNNRKSELPPVQIPQHFYDLYINRHDQPRQLASRRAERTPLTVPPKVLDAVFWSDEIVAKAIETSNVEYITRRTQLILATAISHAFQYTGMIKLGLYHSKHSDDPDTVSADPVLGPIAASLDFSDLAKALDRPDMFTHPYYQHIVRSKDLGSECLIEPVLNGHNPQLHHAAFFDPHIVDEVASAVNAQLSIRPPKDVRLSTLRRPVTIINIPQCAGFSAPQDILRDISLRLGADVLHLRAADIAHIVGSYIGQDVTRAPGDMSFLGYRTAEHSGKLKMIPAAEEEGDDADAFEVPLSITVRQDKSRRDPRRQTISMEDFLMNSGTRGKSDELWEDMKINAALEELVHAADLDCSEQKPLIIHIHDYNALDMDSESGAAVIARIRKVVDELWSTGRKIALVGSCSSFSPNGTPKAYNAKLRGLEKTERVIQMYTRRFSGDGRIAMRSILKRWDEEDFIAENDENIVRVLGSMIELGSSPPREGRLGLNEKIWAKMWGLKRPGSTSKSLTQRVLSFSEVYRIAATMVGLNGGEKLSESQWPWWEAVQLLERADATRETQDTFDKRTIERDDATNVLSQQSSRRNDPRGENHEEKLLSGLVNAQDIRTTFNDIHAPKETIESIKMLTTLSLIRPEAFSYGVLAHDRIPGCLLYGPPGTGKTLLAKAVAKESGANMLEISGASIQSMWIGESEKNVRALFRLAKKKQPMVIFIDEADALLGARGGRDHAGRRETTNQFLREWDGMDSMNAFIMVATNRPFDLDEAVLRRLPRKLLIDLPLETDRAAILKIHLKDEALDETVSIDEIAKQTPLYSGSDLKNVCVAAAMAAVKEELEASQRHTGPEPYKWTEKRRLNRRHFDKALKEISASVSEDMATLTAIRKFDERYGDGKAAKKRKSMGFGVIPDVLDSNEARVRHRAP